jgi:branched-subunit amino acid transport protein
MNGISIWFLFLALALGTFSMRLSFIYLFGKAEMPEWLRRALKYVPAAVLAALVFPALTYTGPELNLSLQNYRLLAGVAGAIVAWKTRNVLLTILVGMALLWILQFAFGL